MIRKGDKLQIKKEWRDPGEGRFLHVAVEDQNTNTVLVEAQLGWPINPTSRLCPCMLEPWEG